jgi:site-specific recombinase XerD
MLEITPIQQQNYRTEIERDPSLKSKHTKRAYAGNLSSFDSWRAGRPLSKMLVEQYAAQLQAEGKSPGTVNLALASIRWMARRTANIALDMPLHSQNEKLERAEFVAHADRVASVRNVRGHREPKGRNITQGELAALMQTCQQDPGPAGNRDAAMIAIAWATGTRRDEIAGLDLADFTVTNDGEGDLLIKGKGDKQRKAFLYNGAFMALTDWLKVRGDQPGPIFCIINKGGRIFDKHRITGEAMRQLLIKRVQRAGVKPLTWHDFRRTFAGNLLDNAQDISTVSRLMGHSDVKTTQGYDRRPLETQRKATKCLFVPYGNF